MLKIQMNEAGQKEFFNLCMQDDTYVCIWTLD